MVHRIASNTVLSALVLSLLFGITGCNTGGTHTDGGISADGTTEALSYSGSTSRTAIVSWTPPTQRVDGSTLTNLAGYRVYYGKSLNAMSRIVEIANPGQISQFIDNLEKGTWYFAVTAYTSDGLESDMSELAAKRIL
jgi:hypothetical protein